MIWYDIYIELALICTCNMYVGAYNFCSLMALPRLLNSVSPIPSKFLYKIVKHIAKKYLLDYHVCVCA